MDGIANVARQQQSQVNSQEAQGRAVEQVQQAQMQTQQTSVVKELQQENSETSTKINSKKDVDSQDVFYVSVIEAQTNKMIRRFPAEKAQDFLPKMQEVSGILFDSKG